MSTADLTTDASATAPYVMAFARAMESKLEINRWKGDRDGWMREHPFALYRRLLEEVEELGATIGCRVHFVRCDAQPSEATGDVLGEAADVGNFAMMLADCVGVLVAKTTGDEP